ncbi:DASH complex subunit ask1 [Actinomortierella ambigua]|uniref:DASH complex subunit ASK1 n=1 Tax=Actinomortierella ambigua TaxID=1343610 RepID=A0A9P6QGD1_9FUNG|nr:DASH complex subunit ask1 [Actinomortierella ambigua]
MSANSTSTPSALPPPTTVDVLDEIERLEQSITRTLQEIDQSFSDCQIIVSSKILPQIDRYAESSAEVWNHARLWLGFLEAAAAPSLPSAPRIRPPSRWNAEEVAAVAADAVESQGDDLRARQQNEDARLSIQSTDTLQLPSDNDTNRRRISMFSLSPSSGLPDGFLGSSPGQPLSSPTPNILKTQPPLARGFSWGSDQGLSSIPSGHGRENLGANSGLSTTPKDKPRPFTTTKSAAPYSSSGSMPNPFASQLNGTPKKGVRVLDDSSRGMVVLDLDQDYQDVITPPKTLQFSVPESKVATTPRAVLEKSKIDRLFMKDGLVVPRPIFTRMDEPETGEQAGADLGESKKRRREGDLQDPGSVDDDLTDEHIPVAWEQGAKSRKGKAVASPRKIPSTRSIFPYGGTTASNDPVARQASQVNMADMDDEQVETGSMSPSERMMASLREQSREDERRATATPTRNRAVDVDVDDPILASLKTPPELRKNLMAYKNRGSPLPQASTGMAEATSKQQQQRTLNSLSATFAFQQSEVGTGATTTAGTDTGRPMRQTTSALPTIPPSATSEPALAHNTPVVTSVPVPLLARTGSATSTTASDMAARSFASIFTPNAITSAGGTSTSQRRQTLAVDALGSNNGLRHGTTETAHPNNGSNVRASLGGSVSFTNRPAFQAIQAPFSQLMNVPSMFATQQSRRDTQPSPASRAAVAAIAATAATASAPSSQWLPAATSTPKGSSDQGQPRDRIGSKSQQAPSQDRFSLTSTPLARRHNRRGNSSGSISGHESGDGAGGGSGSGGRRNGSVGGGGGRGRSSGGGGEGGESGGGDVTQVSSRGIYSASRPLLREDTSHSSILTPFSRRDPPPAPRLGYYSDTMMTQSSLGLNHDGFGAHSDDHTTTRTNHMDSTMGTSRATMTGSRVMMPPPSTGGGMTGGTSGSRMSGSSSSGVVSGGDGDGDGGGSSNSTEDHSGMLHRHRSSSEGVTGTGSMEDDDTTSSFQIRSPCPPSRSGAGSSNQPLTLAAFRGGPFSKPK